MDEGPPDHLLGQAEAVFRDDVVAETHEPTYAVADIAGLPSAALETLLDHASHVWARNAWSAGEALHGLDNLEWPAG